MDDHTFDFADADEVDNSRIHWCGVTADDLGWAADDTSQVKITRSAGTPIAVPDGHPVIWRADLTLGSGSDSEGWFADSWGLLTGPVTFEYKDGTHEAVAVRVPAVLDGEAYREFRWFSGKVGRAVEGDLDVALLEIEHPCSGICAAAPEGTTDPATAASRPANPAGPAQAPRRRPFRILSLIPPVIDLDSSVSNVRPLGGN